MRNNIYVVIVGVMAIVLAGSMGKCDATPRRLLGFSDLTQSDPLGLVSLIFGLLGGGGSGLPITPPPSN